jgi:hypothetical protein
MNYLDLEVNGDAGIVLSNKIALGQCSNLRH